MADGEAPSGQPAPVNGGDDQGRFRRLRSRFGTAWREARFRRPWDHAQTDPDWLYEQAHGRAFVTKAVLQMLIGVGAVVALAAYFAVAAFQGEPPWPSTSQATQALFDGIGVAL